MNPRTIRPSIINPRTIGPSEYRAVTVEFAATVWSTYTNTNKNIDQIEMVQRRVARCPSVKCSLNPWAPWTMSMDSLDIDHGISGKSGQSPRYSGQSPGSPLRLDNVHGLSGHCPLFPWTVLMNSLDSVHGLSGKSGQCKWILWTQSRKPTQTGQCPWTRWKVWTFSTDTLDNVQADWTMSTESMGSLDIVHGQSPLFFLTELVKKLEME